MMWFATAWPGFALEPGSQHPANIEIQVEGGESVGNFHLFAFAENRRLRPFGIEYDRQIFGRLFGAEFDYVGEVLPLVLMNEPARYGENSLALTTDRQEQYGAAISPTGFRLIWRKRGQIQPYWNAKGGFLYFKNRVLSTEGTHLNFSAEFSLGVEKALTSRLGFRAGYSDFHVSNGNIARKNPGIDFMYFNAGLTYQLGK
jgi:Lipid A 3-O-deacylase (PagL)